MILALNNYTVTYYEMYGSQKRILQHGEAWNLQMNGYIISLILDKNPKDYQMTKKLLEIERKRQLTGDAKELIKQLRELGFELQSNLREIDTYYSRPDVDFMQTVECLRIRQRDGFAEVTYKPATTAATHTENDVIIKPETNLPIQPGDAAIAKQLLANLGMVQLVEVNKYRRSFQSSDFPQATVAIDEIKDAGTFVEVEVLSDDETSALAMISEIETKLDLELAGVVTRPYRDICINRKPHI